MGTPPVPCCLNLGAERAHLLCVRNINFRATSSWVFLILLRLAVRAREQQNTDCRALVRRLSMGGP